MRASAWMNRAAFRVRALGACAWLLAALAVMVVPAWAQTANTIDNLTVTKGPSGRTQVRFALKAPPANPPAGFAIANPPRVALDFLDTANGLGRSTQEVADAVLRSVNLVQAGNRTRIVLNLNKPQTFDTKVDGNVVTVTLFDQSDSQEAKAQTVERFAEVKAGDVKHSIVDVDFRRGTTGEGRIIVDLSDNATGIDIRRQGKFLVVDFIGASVPRNLERRLDVQDFGTPVVAVDTLAQGGNARMLIEPKGLWEHSAYQADKRFIVEVKPVQDDPAKLTQGTRQGYKGEKLSLNFQNVETRAVLQVIADFTGLNIITSDSVTGNLTLRLKEVPWDQALDIIMQTKGLDMRKNGNVVLIAPREEIALKEKQQLESQLQISQLEPLQLETFQLNYMRAEDFLNNIISSNTRQQFGLGAGQTRSTGGGGSILSERGVAFVDKRTNILFVQDTPARLEEVRRIIRQLDTPIRQVQIEARIVIATDQFGRELGVRFGVQTAATFNGYALGTAGSLSTQPVVPGERLTPTPYQTASGQVSPGYSTSNQMNVNLPATAIASAFGATPASLALTLINLGSGNLINLELAALEADQRGKIVSSPRVVTGDNQKASIEQGTEIPYTTGSGSTTTGPTTSFKKAVLRLDVTPQITPDNKVIMAVEVRKDAVGRDVPQQGGGSVPSVDTRSVTTQISVNNGDTAVIGGIFEDEVYDDVYKVPVLGDIPVLGYLFKRTNRSSTKKELLIFLTPRIVKETVTAVR